MEDFKTRKRALLQRLVDNRELTASIVTNESNGVDEFERLFSPSNEFELAAANVALSFFEISTKIKESGASISDEELTNGYFSGNYSQLVAGFKANNQDKINEILDQLTNPEIYAHAFYEWFVANLTGKMPVMMEGISLRNGYDPYQPDGLASFLEIWNIVWEKASLNNGKALYRKPVETLEDIEAFKNFLESLNKIHKENIGEISR